MAAPNVAEATLAATAHHRFSSVWNSSTWNAALRQRTAIAVTVSDGGDGMSGS